MITGAEQEKVPLPVATDPVKTMVPLKLQEFPRMEAFPTVTCPPADTVPVPVPGFWSVNTPLLMTAVSPPDITELVKVPV